MATLFSLCLPMVLASSGAVDSALMAIPCLLEELTLPLPICTLVPSCTVAVVCTSAFVTGSAANTG